MPGTLHGTVYASVEEVMWQQARHYGKVNVFTVLLVDPRMYPKEKLYMVAHTLTRSKGLLLTEAGLQ